MSDRKNAEIAALVDRFDADARRLGLIYIVAAVDADGCDVPPGNPLHLSACATPGEAFQILKDIAPKLGMRSIGEGTIPAPGSSALRNGGRS